MKLLIVGSRSINEFDLAPYVPDGVELIISGGACGIDSIADNYADEHRISKLILRPKYELYGRAAPLKRNEQLVDICDTVLAVWDGQSKGTMHTINYARKNNKKIIEIILNK